MAENSNDIALDNDRRVWLAGTSFSNTFPAARHGVDVTTIGLLSDGTAAAQTVWVNPSQVTDQEDYGLSIAVDAAGNRYIGGITTTAQFCDTLASGLSGVDTSHNGSEDGVVFKINSSNDSIAWCTYIGGSEPDYVRDIAVEPDGTLHIVGGTFSSVDFPGMGASEHSGARDMFYVQIDATGAAYTGTVLLGGSANDGATGVALDALGNAFVTGWTYSADFPTTVGAFDTTAQANADAIAARIDNDGNLDYATYLGGNAEDRPTAIAVDAAGKAHIVGSTLSADFPTSLGAYDTSYSGVGFAGYDAWLTVLSSDGAALEYGSYFGGANEDRAQDLAIHGGDIFVVGSSASADFPTTANGIKPMISSGTAGDGFLMQFRPSTNSVTYGTFLGGGDADVVRGVEVDGDGNLYLTGDTKSAEFCTTSGAYDETHNGDFDMFALKLDHDASPTSVSLQHNVATVHTGIAVAIFFMLLGSLTQFVHKKSMVGN